MDPVQTLYGRHHVREAAGGAGVAEHVACGVRVCVVRCLYAVCALCVRCVCAVYALCVRCVCALCAAVVSSRSCIYDSYNETKQNSPLPLLPHRATTTTTTGPVVPTNPAVEPDLQRNGRPFFFRPDTTTSHCT